jgi:hypothetical protein
MFYKKAEESNYQNIEGNSEKEKHKKRSLGKNK